VRANSVKAENHTCLDADFADCSDEAFEKSSPNEHRKGLM